MSAPEKNPAAVALGKLAKKKLGAAHYERIGRLGGEAGGGRPRTYKTCPGRRTHVFSDEDICWFCKKSRAQLLMRPGMKRPKRIGQRSAK